MAKIVYIGSNVVDFNSAIDKSDLGQFAAITKDKETDVSFSPSKDMAIGLTSGGSTVFLGLFDGWV